MAEDPWSPPDHQEADDLELQPLGPPAAMRLFGSQVSAALLVICFAPDPFFLAGWGAFVGGMLWGMSPRAGSALRTLPRVTVAVIALFAIGLLAIGVPSDLPLLVVLGVLTVLYQVLTVLGIGLGRAFGVIIPRRWLDWLEGR